MSKVYQDSISFAQKRKFEMPSQWEAMGWLVTEVGEAYELLLASSPKKWLRNNPEKHDPYSDEAFVTELGDIIFMCCLAGSAVGLDPIDYMYEKMERTLANEQTPKGQLPLMFADGSTLRTFIRNVGIELDRCRRRSRSSGSK